MLADDVPWQNIPGIVVKNLAKPMNQELFNEATCGIEWEKLPYEDYWNVYKKIYGNKWNSDIEKEVNTVRIFSRNRCPIGCKFCSSTAQLTLASGGKVPVISTTESNLISVVDPGYQPQTPFNIHNHLKLGFDDIIEIKGNNFSIILIK